MIRDLFINAMILTTFIFMGGNIFRNEPLAENSPMKKKVIAIIGGVILGITLMFFGIRITENTILDLRHFAILLLMMYAGLRPSIICAIMLSLFRVLYFGLNTSSVTAIVVLFLIIIGTYFIMKMKMNNFIKWIVINIFGLIVVSIAVVFLMGSLEASSTILVNYWIISLFTCFAIYYLKKYIESVNVAFRKLKKQATKDSLTGINNVRSFDKAFNDFIERVKTYDERLSLLLIDIDHFKRVNDTYGHPAGDEVLKQLTHTINDSTRTFDVVSRIGGEEFSVLLPNCPHKRALEVAERIRMAVEEKQFILPEGTEIHITVSVGSSTLSKGCIDKKDNFINEADQGLYLAKKTGRNKVCSVIKDKCINDICDCVG